MQNKIIKATSSVENEMLSYEDFFKNIKEEIADSDEYTDYLSFCDIPDTYENKQKYIKQKLEFANKQLSNGDIFEFQGTEYKLIDGISYKDFKYIFGYTNIAALIAVGCSIDQNVNNPLKCNIIHCESDGFVQGYVIPSVISLPGDVSLIDQFRSWLNIYDDGKSVFKSNDDTNLIEIYKINNTGEMLVREVY